MADESNGFHKEIRDTLSKISQRLDRMDQRFIEIDQRLDLVTLALGGISSLLRKSGLDTSKVDANVDAMTAEAERSS